MMKYCEACGRCADTRVTDKKEIYEMQLDMIATLNKEVDKLKEKIRVLTLENDRLKAGVG